MVLLPIQSSLSIVKLLFVSYGSKELGSGRRRGGDPKATTEAVKEAGIPAHFYVSPETAHEWQTWRRSLRELAPMSPVPARPWLCARYHGAGQGQSTGRDLVRRVDAGLSGRAIGE